MANTVQIILEVDDKGSAKVKQFSSNLKDQVKGISDNVKDSAGAVNQVQTSCSNLLGVVQKLAAGFAAWKVGELVTDSAKLSARVETLGVVMEQVGKNALYLQSEMHGYTDAVKKAGITTQESRQTVTQFVQAHLDLAKASQLARVAQDAAVIGNTNSSESMRGLMHGIVTLQPEILRTYGIIVNFESEYAKFAASIGRTVESLSGQEKQQIALNAVLKAGAGIAGAYEAAMGTVGKQITSLPRLIEEAKLQFGELFKPALTVLVQEFTVALQAAGKSLTEMEKSGKLAEWSRDLATNVKEAIEKTVALAKGIRDVIAVIGPFAVEAAKLLVLGYVAEKVWTLVTNFGKLAAVLKANKEILVFLAAYEATSWLEKWASGTIKIEKETEALRKTLAGQKQALAEATEAVRKKSAVEEEVNNKFQAELRTALGKQKAREEEEQRRHNEALKRQTTLDQEALKKWEAMKETIGLQGYEKDLALLTKEYGAYNRVVQDKVSLERWYSEQKANLTRTAALKVAEEDKKSLESRLSDAQKFYGSVQQLLEKATAQEKKHIEELNALYRQQADIRKSTEAQIRGLQEIGMTPGQKYESQKSAISDQYMAAMKLSGQEQIKALEEYKQALASFGQTWSAGVAETSKNMLFGDKTSVIVAGKDIIKSVISDIEAAAAMQQRALESLTAEKGKQIQADGAWGEVLKLTAEQAATDIRELQGVIGDLESQITAMQQTITITGDDRVSGVVDNIARSLKSLHDKTVYITTVYRNVYAGGGGAGSGGSGAELKLNAGPSSTPYALGTGYVPKTGIYLLHRGEAVTPPAQAARQSSTRIGDINIIIPESAAPQRPEDWRMITRQYIVPELEKIGHA